MKTLVYLAVGLSLVGICKVPTDAFRFGPRLGAYIENFDGGACFQQKEFGLTSYLEFTRSPKKECTSVSCGNESSSYSGGQSYQPPAAMPYPYMYPGMYPSMYPMMPYYMPMGVR